MSLFKKKTHAQESAERSHKALIEKCLDMIRYVSNNGHFSYSWAIRTELGSGEIYIGVVDRLAEELRKEGYTVDVTTEKISVSW